MVSHQKRVAAIQRGSPASSERDGSAPVATIHSVCPPRARRKYGSTPGAGLTALVGPLPHDVPAETKKGNDGVPPSFPDVPNP